MTNDLRDEKECRKLMVNAAAIFTVLSSLRQMRWKDEEVRKPSGKNRDQVKAARKQRRAGK